MNLHEKDIWARFIVMSSAFQYTALRTPVASGLTHNGKQALVQDGQQGAKFSVERTIWLPSTFPTDMFTRPGSYRNEIPNTDYIKHLSMRYAVTIDAPAVLSPVELWQSQIDIYDPSSPSKPIQTWYDDSMLLNLINRTSPGNQRSMFRTSNIESDPVGKYGTAKVLPAGTHYF